MRVLPWSELADGAAQAEPSAVTIGVFDGFHLGHRELVSRVVAKSPALHPSVVTFSSNPKKVMNPHAYQGDLFTIDQKLEALEAAGVQTVVLIDFSGNFSTLAGSDFVSILVRSFATRSFVVGSDFKCGYRHSTDSRAFAGLAGALGAETEIVGHVLADGEPVSSSRIRSAIRAGRTEAAASLLGRPYTLDLRRVPDGAARDDGAVSIGALGMTRPAEGRYLSSVSRDGGWMDAEASIDAHGYLAWLQADGGRSDGGLEPPAFLAFGPRVA